jgi:CheY-like chemotaxis protein
MERQLQHLVRLVDDLLDISKITSGTIPLRCERLEIFDVVYRSIDKISPLLDAGRHVLSLDVPRTGCAVRGDYARLIQSVANLLSNACKYSEPQGEITVTARRQGSKVILSVSDRGAGIEPAFLERIFEPFVQRPQANDRSHGGLGLGLAITRSLIQRHGGEIRVTSDGPGHGSTFEIDLPAFAGAEDGEEERFSGAGQVTDAPPRVLVVDDNEDAADLMAHLLGSIGFDVRVAYDGPSALELADEFQPQVGLLDIGLPVMDGYELAMRLRARRKSEPLSLIAISGYGQEADRVKSRQAGFITHLLKPVEISSVKNLLFETLQCAQPPCPPRSKSPAA